MGEDVEQTEYDFPAVLKVCFEGLGEAEKEILLHLAFLKGKDKDRIERKLAESGTLFGRKEIQALDKKSFISIEGDGKVWMHDLIQNMAWKILEESTKGLGKICPSLITQAIYHLQRTKRVKSVNSYDILENLHFQSTINFDHLYLQSLFFIIVILILLMIYRRLGRPGGETFRCLGLNMRSYNQYFKS